MSRKTLVVLVAVLAALSVAIVLRGGRAPVPVGAGAGGGGLLPAADLVSVRAIRIEDGANTTRMERVDGIWRVAEEDNHPADVARLREMMRSIDGTENPQVADEKPATRLAEYGLAPEGNSAPLRIALEHAGGTTVLSLGKRREPRRNEEVWMPPAGRYVRVDEGPVLLIKDDIAMADANPGQWWDRNLLEVAPEAIRKVQITSAEGAFAIERGTNDTFVLAGSAEDETVDAAAARRLFGALRNLRAESRWTADEAAAFSNGVRCVAEAEGVVYSVRIGDPQSDRNGGRPVKIEATAAEGAMPEQQAAAAAVNILAGRIYLVPGYQAEPLAMKRDALVRKAPPEHESEPEVVPEPAPIPAEEPPPASADALAEESAPS